MPSLQVWGLPPVLPESLLETLREELISEAKRVEELDLQDDRAISVYFPTDRLPDRMGGLINVVVVGLIEKPELTDEIRNRLAFVLGMAVQRHFQLALVQCSVESLDPKQGFWSSGTV